MHRLKLGLVIIAAFALVTASAAVAWHKHGKTHTDPAATTLAATQAEIKNKTCTGEDGAYRQFHGKWTGTATSADARLAGTLRIYARGLVNTATSSGQVTGSLSIRGERKGRLNGFVVGWVHDRTGATAEDLAGSGRLLGTLTGTLGATGAVAAQIGPGGTSPVGAANIQNGGCRNGHERKRKGR